MTETEAKQKLCPYTMQTCKFVGGDIVENDDGTWEFVRELRSSTPMCQASRCMAWEQTCKPVDDKPGEGYCRRFGKQEAR